MTLSIMDRLRAAGLIQTAEPPAPYSAPTHMAHDRATGYASAALKGEADNVASAPEGTRNHALNKAAWKMGRLVEAGLIDGHTVIDTLSAAARDTGLPSGEIAQTVGRAVHDGQAKQYQPATSIGAPQADLVTEVDAQSLRGAASEPQKASQEAVFQEVEEVTEEDIDTLFPILDWHELWGRPVVDDWIIEPILRRGKAIVLYSPPKVGKSLLTLEVAAGVATGRRVLGQQCQARRVLYVDFENDPEDDVRTRLQDMGYEPDHLDNLRYLSFPAMAPLDTETGGRQILAVAKRHQAEVVVIDTLSRAVAGKENDNDTYLDLYRHTVLQCKRAGIAFMRLDHSGKDAERGMRGASAKESDVDAVWKLSVIDVENETLELECTHSRKKLADRTVVLRRVDTPRLTHLRDDTGPTGPEVKAQALVAHLERLGVPREAGRGLASDNLKRAGVAFARADLEEALRLRKSVSVWDQAEQAAML